MVEGERGDRGVFLLHDACERIGSQAGGFQLIGRVGYVKHRPVRIACVKNEDIAERIAAEDRRRRGLSEIHAIVESGKTSREMIDGHRAFVRMSVDVVEDEIALRGRYGEEVHVG